MTLDTAIYYFTFLGPWFFFLGAMTEAIPVIGTFLPGATIIALGGFAAAHGYFSIEEVIFLSITGSILGDSIGYYIGIYGGKLIRDKKIISEKLLQKGEKFFNKYGSQSLLWGRFIGPLRSIMPFLTGLLKVSQKTFWFWNIISAIIWGSFYVLFGYFSGNLFTIITDRWNHDLIWLIVFLVIIFIITWFFKAKPFSQITNTKYKKRRFL